MNEQKGYSTMQEVKLQWMSKEVKLRGKVFNHNEWAKGLKYDARS